MTETIKVATVITPFFVNKLDRNHLGNILDGLVQLNVVIRSNGNGGKDCIVNSLPDSNKLFYLPSNPFYSLDSSVVVPDHSLADNKLTELFKGYNKYTNEQKNRLRYTLYSLAGSELQRKSDIVFILRCNNYTKHPVNHELYKGAILIAHELGIHIVNLSSKAKGGKNVKGNTKDKSDAKNRNRSLVWHSPTNTKCRTSTPTNESTD